MKVDLEFPDGTKAHVEGTAEECADYSARMKKVLSGAASSVAEIFSTVIGDGLKLYAHSQRELPDFALSNGNRMLLGQCKSFAVPTPRSTLTSFLRPLESFGRHPVLGETITLNFDDVCFGGHATKMWDARLVRQFVVSAARPPSGSCELRAA